MDHLYHCDSPLGGITLASDGQALTGLWFDGQKYFGAGLAAPTPATACGAPSGSIGNAPADAACTGSLGNGPAAPDAGMAGLCSVPDGLRPEIVTADAACTGSLGNGSAASDAGAELPIFAETRRWLDIYFSGREPGFTPPLAPRGTPFRRAVWEILLTIPFGQTVSYGQLASMLARQRSSALPGGGQGALPLSGTAPVSVSARAVGGAVGHNPISLIIPCHRVIGADGSLTGYAGGVEKKRRLLALERGACSDNHR